jgi:hypothetical protein
LAEELHACGDLDLSECLIGGAFAVAKKGRTELKEQGAGLTVPRRSNRIKASTRDWHRLERY